MIWLVLVAWKRFQTLSILQAFADPKYVGFASGMTTAIAGVTRSRNRNSVELGWISYLHKNSSISIFASCWTTANLLISWWHGTFFAICSLKNDLTLHSTWVGKLYARRTWVQIRDLYEIPKKSHWSCHNYTWWFGKSKLIWNLLVTSGDCWVSIQSIHLSFRVRGFIGFRSIPVDTELNLLKFVTFPRFLKKANVMIHMLKCQDVFFAFYSYYMLCIFFCLFSPSEWHMNSMNCFIFSAGANHFHRQFLWEISRDMSDPKLEVTSMMTGCTAKKGLFDGVKWQYCLS